MVVSTTREQCMTSRRKANIGVRGTNHEHLPRTKPGDVKLPRYEQEKKVARRMLRRSGMDFVSEVAHQHE
jgi:hypothetical protein